MKKTYLKEDDRKWTIQKNQLKNQFPDKSPILVDNSKNLSHPNQSLRLSFWIHRKKTNRNQIQPLHNKRCVWTFWKRCKFRIQTHILKILIKNHKNLMERSHPSPHDRISSCLNNKVGANFRIYDKKGTVTQPSRLSTSKDKNNFNPKSPKSKENHFPKSKDNRPSYTNSGPDWAVCSDIPKKGITYFQTWRLRLTRFKSRQLVIESFRGRNQEERASRSSISIGFASDILCVSICMSHFIK